MRVFPEFDRLPEKTFLLEIPFLDFPGNKISVKVSHIDLFAHVLSPKGCKLGERNVILKYFRAVLVHFSLGKIKIFLTYPQNKGQWTNIIGKI